MAVATGDTGIPGENIHYASDINTSTKFNFKTWDVDKGLITKDLLYFLWCREPISQFVIDTLHDEAFRYGPIEPKAKEFKLPYWIMPNFTLAAKYGSLFGIGWLYLDNGDPWNQLKTEMTNKAKIVRIKPLHLTHTKTSCIEKYVYDDMDNIIAVFYSGKTRQNIEIHRSRIIPFIGPKKDAEIAGHSMLEPLVDTIMPMKLWERTSGKRAKQHISASHSIYRASGFTSAQLTQIQNMLGETKALIMGGDPTTLNPELSKLQVDEIGRGASDAELTTFQDQSWKNISAGTGTAKSDVTGAEAGAKLSTDSNSSIRVMKLENIQKMYYEPAMEMFEKLNIPSFQFDGWNDPREISEDQRFLELLQLLQSWNIAVSTQDNEIQNLVRNIILEKIGNAI